MVTEIGDDKDTGDNANHNRLTGSAAAALQASIGSVATPSLFATCTSAAEGGDGLVTVTVIVQLDAAAVAMGAAAAANMMDWLGMTKDEAEMGANNL